MPFNSDTFKQHFPLFSQPENDQLVYLDNAATTQRPQSVIDAVAGFYLTSNANTHRSSHRLARRATELVEQTRDKARAFLNAAHSSDVIFTRGATEGLNLLAGTLTEQLQPGDEIVLTTAEHHANLVPWQMAAQRYELTLKFVPQIQGIPQWHRLAEVLSKRTKIVSVTGASNALGFISDLPQVKEQLAGSDAIWVVDAAQLAAHKPLDVQLIGCDFLVCSAHKFYGPTGVGLLYGKSQRLAALPPWQGGGEMIERVELQQSRYAEPPHRFETGTSSLAAIAGLNACFDFWQSVDRDAVASYEQQLIMHLHQQLAQLPHITLLSQPDNNMGVATFALCDCDANAGAHVMDLTHWLDEQDIAVRVGHHCAMPLMDSFAVEATVRVSIAGYNNRHDIERLINGINRFFQQRTDSEAAQETAANDVSLDTLLQLKGWQPRYRQLMQWANLMPHRPEIRLDKNRVQGCETAAWASRSLIDGRNRFLVDSDSRVVKGLAVLLLLLIDNKTTEEIQTVDLDAIFSELGLQKHLSPSRNNGFRALLNKMLSDV